jgi:hypothetical protein
MLRNILCFRLLCVTMLAGAVLVGGGSSANAAPDEPATTAEDKTEKPKYEVLAKFVSLDDSLSKMIFFDGDQVTLNDRCPVRRVRLNPKMGAAYVNGQPIGFC